MSERTAASTKPMSRVVQAVLLLILAAAMMFAFRFGALFLGCANNPLFALLIATIGAVPSVLHPPTVFWVAGVIVILVMLPDTLKTAQRRRWWPLAAGALVLASALVGMQEMLHSPKACDLHMTWR